MLSLESTSSRMTRLAKQELYFGQYFSLDEILAAVDGVTLEHLRSVVAQLLDATPLSLVALGPAGASPVSPTPSSSDTSVKGAAASSGPASRFSPPPATGRRPSDRWGGDATGRRPSESGGGAR